MFICGFLMKRIFGKEYDEAVRLIMRASVDARQETDCALLPSSGGVRPSMISSGLTNLRYSVFAFGGRPRRLGALFPFAGLPGPRRLFPEPGGRPRRFPGGRPRRFATAVAATTR